jgi:hypothetical protein
MRNLLIAAVLFSLAAAAFAQKNETKDDGAALTIYNQNFAVVRQNVPLSLTGGLNHINFTGATARLEPDSVVLRDPSGKRVLQILEQNYRNDPVSQALLLSYYEGQTIDFLVKNYQRPDEIVKGKIVRSGYVPGGQATEPIIEVDGKLRFQLPGEPMFPALSDGTILKPTLNWLMQTDKPGDSVAEVSYITGGFRWNADYNIVAPENGDLIDMVGWITMSNQSGKEFDNAHIKLMAGDVNKIQPEQYGIRGNVYAASKAMDMAAPQVSEKAFDEYHLYTLERATTLHDQETKQIEFVRGAQVKSNRIYVYDGAQIDNRWQYNPEYARNDQGYGTQSNPKVWVMQEIKNSKENNLGIALPAGKLRFYRRDSDGSLQFTGENMIDHTPKDETIRVYTGNSFDIVGERTRTNYHIDTNRDFLDESFEIKVRNHKKEAVQVRVVEHLYRWVNWEIVNPTNEFKKKDSRTAEFTVTIPPDGEKVISYTAHYAWN